MTNIYTHAFMGKMAIQNSTFFLKFNMNKVNTN